jgi:hypothetical protein
MCGFLSLAAFLGLHAVSECFRSLSIIGFAAGKNHIMPIELRTQRDGRVRDTWYGRYEINGRRQYLNLNVKVAGTPPASLSLRRKACGSRGAAEVGLMLGAS